LVCADDLTAQRRFWAALAASRFSMSLAIDKTECLLQDNGGALKWLKVFYTLKVEGRSRAALGEEEGEGV